MRRSRFEQIWRGMSAISRQVYEATPRAEVWGISEIGNELARATGQRRDASTVAGCLEWMTRDGIVRETARGKFTRVAVKDRAPAKGAEEDFGIDQDEEQEHDMATKLTIKKPAEAVPAAQQAEPITSAPPQNTLDLLSGISTGLRQAADQMQAAIDSARAFADQLDDAALAIDGQATAASEEVQKLRQLQALLKSLG